MDTSRYQNGIIYKLCCKDPTIKDVYIGSTCAFRFRKYAHKNDCNHENRKGYNFKVYKFIRDHGGWDNWEMIELLKYPCNTKRELELKEREYLELLGGTLNKTIPTRSRKETRKAYDLEHKEEKKERSKSHYQKNKKEIKEKHNKKFNCDCGGSYTYVNTSQHSKTAKHQKYLESNRL
jgi:hypothetical protein